MSRSQQIISHLPDLRRATEIRHGPDPFRLVYTVDLLGVIENYGLSPHMYADDTQVSADRGNNAHSEHR